MSTRTFAAAVAGVGIAAVGVLPAGAAARNVTHRTTQAAPVVKLANTLVGPLLVNGHGRTVFMFVKDKHNRDVCKTIKGCETDWPAVTTTQRRPALGPGVKRSLVKTIPYKGKLREVTYAGHPLHTYKFDPAPRSVMNIGNTQFGGAWWALNAAGKLVK
jgi:predicted lipoprotein with Yx(FWY)xxD motif